MVQNPNEQTPCSIQSDNLGVISIRWPRLKLVIR